MKIRCNELLDNHGQKKLTLQCASSSVLCILRWSSLTVRATIILAAVASSVQSRQFYIWYDIYLLTVIGLTPGGSSSVHIYPQTIYRTEQLITLVRRLSGIRTQSCQTDWEESGPSLVFALQLRKKHGKTSVRVAEECQLARWKQNMQNREELQTSLNDMFVGCQACVRVQGGYFQHFPKLW